jgi:hypothetical protein
MYILSLIGSLSIDVGTFQPVILRKFRPVLTGEVARGVVVTTIGRLAIFLASPLDGEEGPHDHPGGLDGSESIGTARL